MSECGIAELRNLNSAQPVVYATEGPWTNIYPHLAKGSNARIVPATAGLQDGVALVWGLLRGSPELIAEAVGKGKPWVYIDHGYFKRGHFHGHYRMTWQDFQQATVKPAPDDRWKALGIELKPWRKGGKAVIVCPPSDHVARIFGAQDWLADTLAALRLQTDRPIRVRRKDAPEPLELALRTAHALVAFNSIAAVEAVTLGTPVFVPPKSAAAPVGDVGDANLKNIENPRHPDREAWAHSLAYGQFTINEMRDGTAWRLLRKF